MGDCGSKKSKGSFHYTLNRFSITGSYSVYCAIAHIYSSTITVDGAISRHFIQLNEESVSLGIKKDETSRCDFKELRVSDFSIR